MKEIYYTIDCGHGGMSDAGYVTPGKRFKGFCEGVNTRLIGRDLEMLLPIYIDNGTDDYRYIRGEVINAGCNIDIALKSRTKYVNFLHREYDVRHISIHHNASRNTDAQGCRVLYQGGWSDRGGQRKELAERACAAFARHLKMNCKIVDWSKRPSILHVLSKPKCPSIIAEIGFMTNDKDRQYIDSCLGRLDIFNAFEEIFLGTEVYNR